jgi:hypothetical protein
MIAPTAPSSSAACAADMPALQFDGLVDLICSLRNAPRVMPSTAAHARAIAARVSFETIE